MSETPESTIDERETDLPEREGVTYACPRELCGFKSHGWPDEASAQARGAQHEAEHESGEPMPELREVRSDDYDAYDPTQQEG